jgi:hypothetical protein
MIEHGQPQIMDAALLQRFLYDTHLMPVTDSRGKVRILLTMHSWPSPVLYRAAFPRHSSPAPHLTTATPMQRLSSDSAPSSPSGRPATQDITGAVAWRAPGLHYRKNEAYLDIVETVNALLGPSGGGYEPAETVCLDRAVAAMLCCTGALAQLGAPSKCCVLQRSAWSNQGSTLGTTRGARWEQPGEHVGNQLPA